MIWSRSIFSSVFPQRALQLARDDVDSEAIPEAARPRRASAIVAGRSERQPCVTRRTMEEFVEGDGIWMEGGFRGREWAKCGGCGELLVVLVVTFGVACERLRGREGTAEREEKASQAAS